MKLADIAAVVHHFACDNELVLVVNGGLHIVTCDALAVLDQKSGVPMRTGQLRVAVCLAGSRERSA